MGELHSDLTLGEVHQRILAHLRLSETGLLLFVVYRSLEDRAAFIDFLQSLQVRPTHVLAITDNKFSLLKEMDRLGGVERACFVVYGFEAAGKALFGRLNKSREAILYQPHVQIWLVWEHELVQFARLAPDLYSVRSGVFELPFEPKRDHDGAIFVPLTTDGDYWKSPREQQELRGELRAYLDYLLSAKNPDFHLVFTTRIELMQVEWRCRDWEAAFALFRELQQGIELYHEAHPEDAKGEAEYTFRLVEGLGQVLPLEGGAYPQELAPQLQALESFFLEALSKVQAVWGEESEQTTRAFACVATIFEAQGKQEEAISYYRRTVTLAEQVFSSCDPNLAAAYNNLAGLYYAKGKYTEAEDLYEKAIGIGEKALGPDHPTLATRYNNLAGLYEAKGRYAEAETLYEKAIAIAQKSLGPDHPNLVTWYNNLAGLYRAQGRYAEAEPLYKKVIPILEKALGQNHPNLASAYNNLAGLYRAQGKNAEAEPLYQKAIAIDERVLGLDHPTLATCYNNFAELYRAQGKYAEAEPLYQKAIAIAQKSLGPDHPNTKTFLNNYRLFLKKRDRK